MAHSLSLAINDTAEWRFAQCLSDTMQKEPKALLSLEDDCFFLPGAFSARHRRVLKLPNKFAFCRAGFAHYAKGHSPLSGY